MEFSEIYRHYDKQEEQNLNFRRNLEHKLSKDYLTFYEKLKKRSKLDSISFSILFGFLCFAIHLSAALIESNADSNLIIHDFSFFLSLLNGVGAYLIFNATEKFRDFIVNLIQLTKDESSTTANVFLEIYKEQFLGKRTLLFGFLFGFLNCGLALLFGICYLQIDQFLLFSTFILQVFTIGFIGGITVNATSVIIKLINKISMKDEINLTYFYPDKCAGTLVIGNILFLLSIHFIMVGVFIFLFIHNFPWTALDLSQPRNYYINALVILWKIFPFLLSAIVFFLPTRKLNSILREYKLFEQLKIRKRMNYLTGIIMSLESDGKESKEKIEVLDYHYQKLSRIDQEISELNTWPYNLKYRSSFLAIFIPVIIALILELSKQVISNLF